MRFNDETIVIILNKKVTNPLGLSFCIDFVETQNLASLLYSLGLKEAKQLHKKLLKCQFGITIVRLTPRH